MDARKAGFETYVIEDACRGIDTQGSLAKAWADMAKAGVKRIQSGDIAVLAAGSREENGKGNTCRIPQLLSRSRWSAVRRRNGPPA